MGDIVYLLELDWMGNYKNMCIKLDLLFGGG
jgi:hypothetical protein